MATQVQLHNLVDQASSSVNIMKFESGDLAICEVCGTQYDTPLSAPPKACRVCLVSDDRANTHVVTLHLTHLAHGELKINL